MIKKPLCLSGAMLLFAFPAVLAAQPAAPARGGNGEQRRQETHAPESAQPYGTWNSNWGERPPAPPGHWKRKGDWYRHVRACQQRYHYYYARTDTYRTRSGTMRRCTL